MLPPPGQRVVAIFEQIARAATKGSNRAHASLTSAPGAGWHVGEFRAAGYDAWGVDQTHT